MNKQLNHKMQEMRLNKYIASTGISSRRGADELIKAGKVKVNGQIIIEPGLTINDKDNVEIEDQKIKTRAKKYLLFNKPPGYITTLDDPQNRKTIYNLLPEETKHLKPAGRLDKDSSGLLILTNDGELIQELTHPKKKIPKVYRVVVEGKMTKNELLAMGKGIEIEKGKIAYADAHILGFEDNNTILEIVLYQGYNRQIRKMTEKLYHPVISLKRIAHANITLTGLHKGEYRYLNRQEVQDLFNFIKKY